MIKILPIQKAWSKKS